MEKRLRISNVLGKIMRFTFVQMALLVLFGSISYAHNSYSQDILNQPVSINAQSVEMKKVLADIEKQTTVKFIFSNSTVKTANKITFSAASERLSVVLSKLLPPLSISYEVVGSRVLLKKADTRTGAAEEEQEYKKIGPVSPIQIMAFVVSGTVVDENNEPLVGASVVLEGTTKGTLTDENGIFRLELDDSEKNGKLIFSYVGYQKQVIALDGRNSINIILKEISALNEVIVVGYGTQKKRDISTSVSSVSSKDIKDAQVAGFDQAIAGKMAGIRVSNSNPAPGSGQNVIIRGIGSISASPAPLYVIDGMPLPESYDKNENPLNAINPIDIESIEVLKDASATAIYGARGSNGVILITTKRGKTGKPLISFSSNIGVQSYFNKIDMLNTSEYIDYLKDTRSQSFVLYDPFLWDDTRRTHSWSTPDNERIALLTTNDFYNQGWKNDPRTHRWVTVNDALKNSTVNTNWMDVITRNALTQNYQLSANGGNDVVSYMASANYLDQDGIIKNTGYTRYGFRANMDIKATKNIKFGLNLAPSYEVFEKIGSRSEGFEGPNGFIAGALLAPPVYAPYNDDGSVKYLGNYPSSPYEFNIVEIVNPLSLLTIQSKAFNTRNMGSIYGEVEFTKNFKFRSELNTDLRNRVDNFFQPSSVPLANTSAPQINVGTIGQQNRLYLNAQNYLTYNGKINDHSFGALIGYQAEKTSWKNSFIRKQNFLVDDITTLNTAGTILNPLTDATSTTGASSFLGIFSRFNYNFKNKYYFTATLRRDGSSKFGSDNRWGNFPSFSAAWRVTDESFFPSKLKNVISDWKVRGGWGIVGNSSIADFLAYNRLNSVSYMFGATPAAAVGLADAGIAYTGLGWEATRDFNIGSDIDLFRGRINVVYDYYVRKTTDMLFNVSLSAVTGFGSQTRNVSSMENRGMEFTLNTQNFVGDFKWNTSFNIYYNRNKVLDLGPQKTPIFAGDGADNTVTVEGKPLSNFWGYQYLGPYKSWEDIKNSPIVGGNNTNPIFRNIPGDAKYADINGDGIIDRNDFTIIGNPQPDFIYGITNQVSYKHFDLSVQINGVQGGDVSLRTFKREVFGGNGGRYNIPRFYYENYWKPDRTDALYEVPARRSNAKQFFNSSQNIEKGTYLSINNITLGYTLPQNVLSKMRLTSLRYYLSVQNAFLLTKYHGWNPEANTGGINATQQGVDETGYPMARTIAMGLNLSF